MAIKATSIPYLSLKAPVAMADRISVRTAATMETPTPNRIVKKTIRVIKGTAIIPPKIAIKYGLTPPALDITAHIPAILGHITKNAKAKDKTI